MAEGGRLTRARLWWQALARVRRKYAEAFGRRLPLHRVVRPRTQSERIQHQKFLRRDRRLPVLADKIEVKEFVASRVGSRFVIPTLWSGDRLPPRRKRDWPAPYVLKASHGCGWHVFVSGDEPVRWGPIERKVERWSRRTYGLRAGEWHYARMPRRLLVEPHLGDPGVPADDYKLWVYHGRVHYVHWISARGTHTFGGRILDRDWNEAFRSQTVPTSEEMPPRPETLDVMLWLGERLGAGFPFVRVDLYEIDGHPYVGELTFFPTSGFHRVEPPEVDRTLGELWRRPRSERYPAAPMPDLSRLPRPHGQEVPARPWS